MARLIVGEDHENSQSGKTVQSCFRSPGNCLWFGHATGRKARTVRTPVVGHDAVINLATARRLPHAPPGPVAAADRARYRFEICSIWRSPTHVFANSASARAAAAASPRAL